MHKNNDIQYSEVLPPTVSRVLEVQREEKQMKNRPDKILIDKEQYEEQQERYHLLWAAINGLPRMQKQCFVFKEDMGWTEEKIAGALKISQQMVSKHIQRAKRNLRKNLSIINPANKDKH